MRLLPGFPHGYPEGIDFAIVAVAGQLAPSHYDKRIDKDRKTPVSSSAS